MPNPWRVVIAKLSRLTLRARRKCRAKIARLCYRYLVSCPNGSCLMCRLRGLYLDSALREPRNARQNLIGGLSSRETLLIRLMRLVERLNCGLPLGHTVVRPATQVVGRQFPETTLHLTLPRPIGGRE